MTQLALWSLSSGNNLSWSKVAGFQAVVVWHWSQSTLSALCNAFAGAAWQVSHWSRVAARSMAWENGLRLRCVSFGPAWSLWQAMQSGSFKA